MNQMAFRIIYDHDSDVLYVSSAQKPAAKGIESDDGIVWRYDSQGSLIGATVMDYHENWNRKIEDLVAELALRFGVPAQAIEQAMAANVDLSRSH
jgi:uncharacterized protein YuzE